MHIGLSGRALVNFFILELSLLGLLALTGEVPAWVWFVASALLYAALWTHDNRRLVRLCVRRAPRALAIAGPAGIVLLLVGGAAVYWVASDTRTTTSNAVGTVDQAILTVARVVTAQLHDPIKLEVALVNVGKLPTTKAQMHVDYLIADSPTPASAVDKKFAEFFTDKNRWPMYDLTLVPGIGHVLHIETGAVTKKVVEEVRAGKKNFFVFVVAEYTDATTPSGKRVVTEAAFRSSPYASPMRRWSLVRDRSYISD